MGRALRRRYGRAEAAPIAVEWTGPIERHDGDYHYEGWRSSIVTHGHDAKGRLIGNYAAIQRASYYRDPKMYVVSTQATRDGKHFGAISTGTAVATFEEAQALAVKKLGEARKRYEKLIAKGEGRQFRKS